MTLPDGPVRPAGLSADYDAFWDAEKGVKWDALTGEMKSLRTMKAEADIRRQGVPEKPDGYKIEPATFKAPEGSSIKISPEHPAAKPATEWAHKWGVPQEAFGELLDVHAAVEAANETKFNETAKVERAKLGANAQARVDAITTALKGRLGPDLADALNSTMFTAKSVEAVEKLLRGTGPAYEPARTADTPAKQDYSKLVGAERFMDKTLWEKSYRSGKAG